MIYVAGGYDGNNSLATAEAFDPQQNRWEWWRPWLGRAIRSAPAEVPI